MKKDWKNLNDKELDELFRMTSGKYSIPFQPDDWKKMEILLPNIGYHFPRGMDEKWFSVGFVIGVGLYLLSGLFLANHMLHFSPEPPSKSEFEKGSSIDKFYLEQSPLSPIFTQPSKENYEISENKQGVQLIQITEDTPGREERHDHSKRITFSRRPVIPIKTMVNRIDWAPAATFSNNFSAPDLSSHQKFSSETTLSESTANFKRFTLTTMLSPDVSAIRINEIQGLGKNFGVYFEYFFTPKISVVTGGLYGDKNYRTVSSTLDPNSYYPHSEVWEGQCQVLDIPLNIRYYAIHHKNNLWYASGGLSSYFMLSERYDIRYESNGQVYTQHLDLNNQNQHIYGIINMSVGYERLLHDKWSLQIEPYYKMPLSGIGEGEIPLKSAGVLVGLKYRW